MPARLVLVVAAVVLLCDFAGAGSSADVPRIVGGPTWSPDGKEVAFAREPAVPATGSQPYQIVTVPVSGAGPTRTVYASKDVYGCCDPMVWGADGRIVFDSEFSLVSVSPNARTSHTLARNIAAYILSRDGATAAFYGPLSQHDPVGIGLVKIGGGKPRMVARPTEASDVPLSFSPDETALVFDRYQPASQSRVLMVERVRGGAPVPLTTSGVVGAARLPPGTLHAQWSPDGRWIAFEQGLGTRLEIVRTTGDAAPHTLARWVDGGLFSWSPNSKLVACYCGPSRDRVHLTTVAPQGAKATIVWSSRFGPRDTLEPIEWSPDGSKLAFLAPTGPGHPDRVWVVGADGTGLKLIA